MSKQRLYAKRLLAGYLGAVFVSSTAFHAINGWRFETIGNNDFHDAIPVNSRVSSGSRISDIVGEFASDKNSYQWGIWWFDNNWDLAATLENMEANFYFGDATTNPYIDISEDSVNIFFSPTMSKQQNADALKALINALNDQKQESFDLAGQYRITGWDEETKNWEAEHFPVQPDVPGLTSKPAPAVSP